MTSSKKASKAKILSLVNQKGDFFLSKDSFPHPGAIVGRPDFVKDGTQPLFNVSLLSSYLDFLELVVLNQRIISPVAFDYSDYVFIRLQGMLPELTEQIENELEGKVLFKCEFVLDEPLHVFFKRYLRCAPSLRKKLHRVKDFEKFFHKPDYFLNDKTFVKMLIDYADPLYLSEAALKVNLPFAVSKSESERISVFERLESSTYRSVVEILRQRLNRGARNELSRLEKLGEQTIFPETPISWQIVRESKTPMDLLRVALELREEYKDFRKAMIELEIELLDQSTTLERKVKIHRELVRLADELWAQEDGYMQKVTREVTDLVGTAAKAATGFSLASAASLTKSLLCLPTEQILHAIRRRKVRVMLKAKKKFLEGKEWIQKLSSIFSLNEETIRNALISQKKEINYRSVTK